MHDNPTLFRKPAMAYDRANGEIPAVPLPDADAELGRRFKAWCDLERECDQQPSAAENTPLDAECRAALWRFYHTAARTPAGAALKLATLMPSIVGVLISDSYADVVDACNDPSCHNIDEMAPVAALDDLLRLAEAEAAAHAADAELGRRFKAWCDLERECDQQPSAAENTPLDAECRAALWRFYHTAARTPAGAALKLATLMPSIVGVLISNSYADVVDACNDPSCHNIDEMAPVAALDDLLRLAEAEAAAHAADAELVAAVDEVFSLSARMAAVEDEADDAPEFVALQRQWTDLIHYVIRTPSRTAAGLAAKARMQHCASGEFDPGDLLPLDGTGWHDDVDRDWPLSMMRDAVRLGGGMPA